MAAFLKKTNFKEKSTKKIKQSDLPFHGPPLPLEYTVPLPPKLSTPDPIHWTPARPNFLQVLEHPCFLSPLDPHICPSMSALLTPLGLNSIPKRLPRLCRAGRAPSHSSRGHHSTASITTPFPTDSSYLWGQKGKGHASLPQHGTWNSVDACPVKLD